MKLFLDTGALVAFHNKDDEHHAKSRSLFIDITTGKLGVTKLYCSDYILDESITTCYARTRSRRSAVDLGKAILDSKSVVILKVDKNVFEEAWRVFSKKFLDIPISFTDSTTYVLTQVYSIPNIFSFDTDFDKLGLARIPK